MVCTTSESFQYSSLFIISQLYYAIFGWDMVLNRTEYYWMIDMKLYSLQILSSGNIFITWNTVFWIIANHICLILDSLIGLHSGYYCKLACTGCARRRPCNKEVRGSNFSYSTLLGHIIFFLNHFDFIFLWFAVPLNHFNLQAYSLLANSEPSIIEWLTWNYIPYKSNHWVIYS